MSFRRAFLGLSPNETARPPQKGSTRRRWDSASHSGRMWGISHRFPPAHFRSGRSGSVPLLWASWLSAVETAGVPSTAPQLAAAAGCPRSDATELSSPGETLTIRHDRIKPRRLRGETLCHPELNDHPLAALRILTHPAGGSAH